MVKKGYISKFNPTKFVAKSRATKNATVIVSPKSLRSTLKKLGVDLPAGQKSYTFKGDKASLTAKFTPLTRLDVPIGRGRKETRARGLLVGKDVSSVTLKAGSLGRLPNERISSLSKGAIAQRSNRISVGDPKQYVNFGLRADGSARLGYTIEQCAFSQAYIRAGGRGDYDRYGTGSPKGYNYSVIHQVRVRMGVDARVQQRSKR